MAFLISGGPGPERKHSDTCFWMFLSFPWPAVASRVCLDASRAGSSHLRLRRLRPFRPSGSEDSESCPEHSGRLVAARAHGPPASGRSFSRHDAAPWIDAAGLHLGAVDRSCQLCLLLLLLLLLLITILLLCGI